MVATVMRQSLVKYDIFNNNKLRGNKAFKKSNIKQDNLRKLILTVATEWNIPHGILRKATKPLIFKNNQIICCVGDSVYAPFWPKGTGVKLS